MDTSAQNFKVVFNDNITRQQFKIVTGIDASQDIADFISFINYISTDQLVRKLEDARVIKG